VAKTLYGEATAETADPFDRRDGWRSHGVMARDFDFRFRDKPIQARLIRARDGALTLAVDSVSSPLHWTAVDDAIDIAVAGMRATVNVYERNGIFHVFTPQGATQITSVDALSQAGGGLSEGGQLTAPMPGRVVSFAVKPGDAVIKGQPLAIIEAMKMEHTIASPADGIVAELLYDPGDQVTEGAELLRLAA
jgi:3-methylcrotonyl-CoA carboxylase alpha subunit